MVPSNPNRIKSLKQNLYKSPLNDKILSNVHKALNKN